MELTSQFHGKRAVIPGNESIMGEEDGCQDS